MLSESADKRIQRSQKSRALPDISLVARDREFAVVLDHIARRKSLHIYGEGGTGKSALLDEVYDYLKARGTLIPIYCRSSRTLREILSTVQTTRQSWEPTRFSVCPSSGKGGSAGCGNACLQIPRRC